jgi:disulfide bond formation protein DsbB
LRIESSTIAALLGGIALALMAGALGFQYLDRLPPCEMCMWQRWPLIAAIVLGLAGGLMRGRAADLFAILALVLVGTSGAIGAYQAGIEWHWWAGPTACTGARFVVQVGGDLNAPMVRCDVAAWRLFRISLAGYNALICLGAASIASVFLLRSQR